MGVVRWDFKGTNHKWRLYPIPIKIGVLVSNLGLNLVRLCANFVNISMHLFGRVGLGELCSSFSCCNKSKPDRTLTRTRTRA